MKKSSLPKHLTNKKSEVEIVKERTLLEFETNREDGSTYIARVYQPRTIPETNSDMSFMFNLLIRRFKKTFLNVLVNLRIIRPKD